LQKKTLEENDDVIVSSDASLFGKVKFHNHDDAHDVCDACDDACDDEEERAKMSSVPIRSTRENGWWCREAEYQRRW
jgi:hypothetical protein